MVSLSDHPPLPGGEADAQRRVRACGGMGGASPPRTSEGGRVGPTQRRKTGPSLPRGLGGCLPEMWVQSLPLGRQGACPAVTQCFQPPQAVGAGLCPALLVHFGPFLAHAVDRLSGPPLADTLCSPFSAISKPPRCGCRACPCERRGRALPCLAATTLFAFVDLSVALQTLSAPAFPQARACRKKRVRTIQIKTNPWPRPPTPPIPPLDDDRPARWVAPCLRRDYNRPNWDVQEWSDD